MLFGTLNLSHYVFCRVGLHIQLSGFLDDHVRAYLHRKLTDWHCDSEIINQLLQCWYVSLGKNSVPGRRGKKKSNFIPEALAMLVGFPVEEKTLDGNPKPKRWMLNE